MSSNRNFVALVDLRQQQASLRRQKYTVLQINDACNGIKNRQYLSTVDNTTQETKTGIYEVQGLSHPKSSSYASFFVGSRIVSNPSLHLISRIDPLFLLLSYFESNETDHKWQPWNQICESRHVHQKILQALGKSKSQLQHFFQINDSLVMDEDDDSMILYKFQGDMVLKWLKSKTEKVQLTLTKQLESRLHYESNMRQHIGKSQGAFSSSFIISSKESDRQKNEKVVPEETSTTTSQEITLSKDEEQKILISAIQIICEYVSPLWQLKLLSFMNLDKESVLDSSISKAKKKAGKVNDNASNVGTPSLSSPSLDDRQIMSEADKLLLYTTGGGVGKGNGEMDNDLNDKKRKAQNSKSAGLKQLQKVNTKGMKSLSSFFSPAAKGSKNKKKKLK